jgi:hypothetical protein
MTCGIRPVLSDPETKTNSPHDRKMGRSFAMIFSIDMG